MENFDNLKTKMFILIVSLVLTGMLILLYFLDDSLAWTSFKIFSCVIINLWLFFVLPAFRKSYLINKDKSFIEWFRMGFSVGVSGFFLSVILAPYYGLRYYLNL